MFSQLLKVKSKKKNFPKSSKVLGGGGGTPKILIGSIKPKGPPWASLTSDMLQLYSLIYFLNTVAPDSSFEFQLFPCYTNTTLYL